MQKKAQKLSFGDQCFMYLGMEARTDFFFFFLTSNVYTYLYGYLIFRYALSNGRNTCVLLSWVVPSNANNAS